jgi:DNA polymerase-3 subunit gamma/tau
MSVLGQVIAGSGPDGVTYADTVSQLGVTDRILLDETVEALLQQDGGALFRVVDRVIEAGHDPRTYVTDLLSRFRDLIVLKNVPDATDLIDAPEDEVAREIAQAERFGMTELTRAADITSATVSGLRNATAPRLHLELMAARLLLPAADADVTGLRAQMDQLERRVASAPVHAAPASAPAPAPASAPVSAPVSAPAPIEDATEMAAPAAAARRASAAGPRASSSDVPAPPRKPRAGRSASSPADTDVAPVASPPAAPPTASGDVDQFVSMWPAVLEALKQDSRVAWVLFESSRPVSLSNGALAVAVGEPGKLSNISSSKHDERLRQAVIDVMKSDVRIDVVLAPDRVGSTSAAGTSAPTAPAEPDTPSLDDTDVVTTSGIDLALSDFGATQIGEIER